MAAAAMVENGCLAHSSNIPPVRGGLVAVAVDQFKEDINIFVG